MIKDIFETYFQALQSHKISEITEHTYRPALEAVLTALSAAVSSEMSILHEPARKQGFGAPDYLFSIQDTIIGYAENKKITQSLDEILSSEQIAKYTRLHPNLLITNYVEFIWLYNGEIKRREELCKAAELFQKAFKAEPAAVERVASLITMFLQQQPQTISDPKIIATLLAERTRYLFHSMRDDLREQRQDEGKRDKLWSIYDAFRSNVYADMTTEQFADTYAQTFTYGLFTARLNADGKEPISLRNADLYIIPAFELIQNMLLESTFLYKSTTKKWIIDEILHIINHIDLRALQENLAFSQAHTDSENEPTDPYMYFYEEFLGAYNPALRKGRGVYYTPSAVVKFIVESIDHILKSSFQIADGLADAQQVTVLDFATGTGTFLFEIFEKIHSVYPLHKPEGNQLISSHLLTNIYGFEYLSAPYVIAHLKLAQYLKEKGNYSLKANERIRLYLTNTLEKITPQTSMIMRQLAEEGKLAQAVKDRAVLVITGNPPYAGNSMNDSETAYQELKTYKSGKSKLVNRTKATWIGRLLKDYFEVDGIRLTEKNTKWLQDDYVKFIRFAQHKIDQAGHGVVAIITNHSFLDNPTFRGMRKSLMQSFDSIYVLDLHGNAKKKERMPDDYAPPFAAMATPINNNKTKDENVFDIQQGVAISVFIKTGKGTPAVCDVFRADLFGNRKQKYQLLKNSFFAVKWQPIQPTKPFYLFVSQDATIKAEYEQFWSVKDIFDANNVGIVTGKDAVFINISTDKLYSTIQQEYPTHVVDVNRIKAIAYRPFDNRKIYYDAGLLERAREGIMSYMERGENIALALTRQVKAGTTWQHCLITPLLMESTYISNRTSEIGYLFPLYRYEESWIVQESDKEVAYNKVSNISPAFIAALWQQYAQEIEPTQIMAYLYAILYAPTYRSRYIDFLKTDFPRVPLIPDFQAFLTLATLGNGLIKAHLLQDIPQDAITYDGEAANSTIEKPFHTIVAGEARMYINATNYFTPVPESVWKFQVGGYQVVEKYLKDRKGVIADTEIIRHLRSIIRSIGFTLAQMEKIDAIFQQYFPANTTTP